MQSLAHDGVKLCFEEAGTGGPSLLLVHGWTCDHSYMASQFAHFQKNHRVIAVDLRWHGQSDKPEQDYSVQALRRILCGCVINFAYRSPLSSAIVWVG